MKGNPLCHRAGLEEEAAEIAQGLLGSGARASA